MVHLKAAGKSFEHKIYDDAPGGHSFERIDTTYAHNVRKDLYAFLDKHLRCAGRGRRQAGVFLACFTGTYAPGRDFG